MALRGQWSIIAGMKRLALVLLGGFLLPILYPEISDTLSPVERTCFGCLEMIAFGSY